MAAFDPRAATAAWLARVPEAARAAAERHAQAELLAWVLGLVGPLLVAALLVRSGAVERVWRWSGRGGALAAGFAVVGLAAVASCGWEAFTATVAGAGPPDPLGFCTALIVRGLLFAGLLGALKLAGRRPRMVLGGLAAVSSFALVFGPTVLDDLHPAALRPAPAAVVAAARDVARASGITAGAVGMTPSAPGEGDVIGLFRPARLLLRPEAAGESLAEVRAGLGHVLGHFHARDGFGMAMLLAGVGVGGVLFVVGLCGPVERLGRKSGERGLHDPRSLPILWALTAVWVTLAQPVTFAWDRAINMRADRFSLEHAREPEGLVLGLIRQNGLAPVDPPAIERWIVCSHPPLKDRIDQAMRWKADHAR